MRDFFPPALVGLYYFCEQISEGSFGNIYLAIHALTRQRVAIKVLDTRRLGVDYFRVRGEINALKTLSHPHIYSLYQVVETKSIVYLIVEYLPGGELFDYILQQGSLHESEARSIFRQILSAVGYAHAKGIVHRDLKPENILLDDEQNIRVIDFGLCAKSSEHGYLKTFCGSLAYASPEVLANKEYNGNATDIWSMGVILYALLCGCLPFDPSKPEKLTKHIAKGQYTIDVELSTNSRSLLSRMLCVDPENRIKMGELCQHPWITETGEGPVDLYLDSKKMQFLNPEIVKEMAMYTRIPKIEMSRMLKKKSYDYLMATYLIMEHLLLEKDIIMPLEHRGPQKPENVTRSIMENEEDKSSVIARRRTSRMHTTFDSSIGEDLIFRFPPPPPMRANSIDVPSPKQHVVGHTRNVGLQTSLYSPKKKASDDANCSNIGVLSPGRSIDSQLNELTKSLRLNDRKACQVTTNQRPKKSTLSDNRTFLDDSVNVSEDSQLYSMQSLRTNLTSDKQTSKMSTSSGGSHGPSGLFKHMFARRAISSSSRASSTTDSLGQPANPANLSHPQTPTGKESQKLRRVRQGNNTIYIRPGFTAAEVLERIADSLHKNSIRFTLKRHGFTCTFANDWGQTQLSFELETVNVSPKVVFPKLQLSKPFAGVGKRQPLSEVRANGPTGQPATLTNSGVLDAPCSEGGCHLGIKMKRLHGDAFTYASICRMVLDQADVKADVG